MTYFQFDGRNSEEFGMCISGRTYNAPERDISYIEVPGRNGDLIIDNGRYRNVDIAYLCGIKKLEDMTAVKRWLLSSTGYKKLVDTYDPEHFRLASYSRGLEVETKISTGTFTVTFCCKPLRYLFSGEETISFDVSGGLYNQFHEAEPKLTIYGSGGTVTIGTQTIAISELDGYVTIDDGNAYKGTINKNATVSMPDKIVLENGDNAITISGGITKVEIVPRWCEI